MRLTLNRLDERVTPRAGDLDLTFGTGGKVALSQFLDIGAVEVASDGGMVVAGRIANLSGGADIGILRLLPNGQPDPSFGTDGLVSIGFDDPATKNGEVATALALRSDGGVVMVGGVDSGLPPGYRAPILAVFRPDGQPDPDFKTDGKITFPWQDGLLGPATDVAIHAGGVIVIAGIGLVGTPSDTALVAARFLPDGRFDPSFGGDGTASIPAGPGNRAESAGIAADAGVVGHFARPLPDPPPFVDPDNGFTTFFSNTRANVLVRMTPAGILDGNFGIGGEVPLRTLMTSQRGRGFTGTGAAFEMEADGRPVVRYTAGGAHILFPAGTNRNDGAARYLADGSQDPHGLPDNIVLFAPVGGTDVLLDGRMLSVTYQTIRTTPPSFDLVRIAATGELDDSFGVDGTVDLDEIGLEGVFQFPTPVFTRSGGAILFDRNLEGKTTFVRLLGDDPRAPLPLIAVGSGAGGLLQPMLPTGSATDTITAFPGFAGAVHTAAADFNGDGVDDLVAGTGTNIATQVRILDGVTYAQLFAVQPFEASFTGGVYVAAGDVDGDGVPDLAITPDEGGGPRVDLFSGGKGFAKIASFFGIDDTNFRGGARAAIADMTGDGSGDLIVVAGFGGGPRVAGFDGTTLSKTPQKIFGDFFAFEQTLRNGVFVAAGDLDGDGFADLFVGGGPGGGPRVMAFDGKSLLSNQYVPLANFFAGDPESRGGIRLAVKDLDGDAKADLVVGAGSGAGSNVASYLGRDISPTGTPPSAFDFPSFPGFAGGVFVG